MIVKIIALIFFLAVFVSVIATFIFYFEIRNLKERVEELELEVENINPKLS